ncbi:MAG TPA: DUF1843 domain-containing protein [Thermoanaerobaculia bacterium]|nr:DUF1843 domain-containing protein [Thermoanaerobaculia bacterium]
MAAKKTASKTTKATGGPIMPYGAPISDAIKSGNQAAMRKLLTSSRKYHADLGKAIDKLEAALKK